ncbi:hypothetical protein [Paenibacillus sp. CF384]|uniref:hypothetical protein n=1 Tax=Paenibacillus sp. CF384 TaxID=1884382 RepID=UPI00089D6D39|nr:hypothetical protein [Paenibacillus sp. CF384]SDX05959.1 hypothetical protein SAMN05518855_1008100 [Paenibacillus sp. CF384]
MNFITKQAIESLSEKLRLPKLDPNYQDWEFEVADSRRVNELISFYESAVLDQDEKFALMSLIISSFDDAIREAREQHGTWDSIKKHLIRDMVLHKNTILYWSLLEEEFEDYICITPYMRQIIMN